MQAREAAGAQQHSEGLQYLVAEKCATLVALADAKYDRIVHVRQAANKAITEVESLPDLPTNSKSEALPESMLPEPPRTEPPQPTYQAESQVTSR